MRSSIIRSAVYRFMSVAPFSGPSVEPSETILAAGRCLPSGSHMRRRLSPPSFPVMRHLGRELSLGPGSPRRAGHPLGQTDLMQQSAALTAGAERDLAADGGQEVPVECAPRERAHDAGPHVVHEVEAHAADVETGRPVEQERLDTVVERHRSAPCAGRWRSPRSPRPVGATPWRRRNRRAISPPSYSKQRSFARDPGEPDVVHQGRSPQDGADRRRAPPVPRSSRPSSTSGPNAPAGIAAATAAPSPRPPRRPRPPARRSRRSSTGSGARCASAHRSRRPIGRIVSVNDDRRKHASLVRPAPSRLHLPGHPGEPVSSTRSSSRHAPPRRPASASSR